MSRIKKGQKTFKGPLKWVLAIVGPQKQDLKVFKDSLILE